MRAEMCYEKIVDHMEYLPKDQYFCVHGTEPWRRITKDVPNQNEVLYRTLQNQKELNDRTDKGIR